MKMVNTALCVLAAAAMGFLLIALLTRYFVRPFRGDVLGALLGPERTAKRRVRHERAGQVFLYVLAAFVVSRAFVWAVGLAGAWLNGQAGQYLSQPLQLWLRWDANHYVGLAENWYVAEGDARLHLVFFPLYPLLMRALHLGFSMDAAWAGVLVSNVCLLAAGWVLFRLVETEAGADGARRATRYLMFAPLSLFFSIPYSESLFLMLTLLCTLMARRRKFALAVLFGALAANARILGMLCAVPIYYEMLLATREKKGGWRMALRYALCTLPVALGLAAYLYLNWQVTGDPLRFLTYQREHWSQRMGNPVNTLGYTLTNAFYYTDEGLRWGTWIPQSLYILGTIALLLGALRRVHPGDGAYALLYVYFAVSPTWLLSGPRYLTAMYALYPILALLTKKKWQDYAVTIMSLAASAYFVYCYTVVGSVL